MKSVRYTVKCRDEDELFKTLTEELPVGVCIIQDGKFCYVNSTFPIAVGYTMDELVGKGSLDIVVPEDREMVKENTMKMLTGELRSPYQFRVTGKDGSIVWVMGTVKSIQYHGRRAVLGNYMEVTERRLMEEAIRQSEERYKELADSITDVFFAMDENLRYTYWNKASEILTGVRMEDAIGKSIQEVFPDKPWRRKAEEMYRKVLKANRRQTFVNDYNIDGRHYILEISAYPSQSGIAVFVRDITERRQTEEALRDSQERYRALFDRSLDCVYVHDFEGNFLDANETALKLFGYERADIPHLNLASLLSEGQLPEALATLQELKDTGTQKQMSEFRVRCRDGSFVDVETIAAAIYRDGQPYAIQGIGRDATQRRRAEERLREAEEEKSAFLEEAPVAIIHTDLDGRITYVNSRFELESGYSRNEIIGRVGLQLGWFSADTTKYLAERMVARLRGNPAKHWQTQFKCKDGRLIWIELEGKVISRLGVPVGFQIISNNVTERKEAEESLRQSEERYRTMLEEMEEGYYEVDIAGNFTFVNDAMSRILGYSRDELIGMNYKVYTPKEDVNLIFQAYNRVYRTGEPLKWFPMPEIRKDGTQILAEDSVFALRNERAEVVGFRGISRDITERRRAEEALRQSEEKYRTILEEMEDAYFEVDLGGHLTFVNSSTCRNLGYSREELIGMSYKAFTVEEDGESVFRVFNEVYRSGVSNKGFPWRVLRKDGGQGFAEASISLLRNDKGEIIGFRGVGRDVTERKNVEEALNIQRAYFQQLFDTSPDAIIMMDTHDRTIQVNKGFEKLFGYSNEEAKGRSLTDLIVPQEDAQDASKSLRKILGGEIVRKERVRRRKDGSSVDVSILAYPICFNGKLIGAYGIYSDITERRRQEQALADELTRRRLLIDQSLDGIVVLDVNARVVEANQRFADMLGCTLEEVRELHTWDWDKSLSQEEILDMGRKVDEKGFRLETKHTRKDGSVIEVDISINGAMCAGQKLVFCVCRDVTARKKMSEALELAAQEWRRTFDSISDAVSIHDKDFRIQRANKAFTGLFGKSLHEIIGSHCYELHKGSKPRSACPHQYTLTSGKPAAAEFYESHLGKYLLESTSPILNERGETVGAVHITRDITEQKRQNERLAMADRLASLGELAAGTAHELNNPLTTIIGFSQLLMEREVPDDIREDLRLINSEAQRAARVTRNLLTFARKRAPVKELNQINNIIEDVLKLRSHEHKVNCIEVEKRLAPDLPRVMVDYYQMQQVFLNIIMNAEYSMIETHKKGTLTIVTKKQNGNTVRISIADDGPGIPEENLGRIFDPFFTTKAAGKGTGLGLSICHGIVAEHGGQIYAKGQPGQGAIIFVELPINGNNRLEVAL